MQHTGEQLVAQQQWWPLGFGGITATNINIPANNKYANNHSSSSDSIEEVVPQDSTTCTLS